MNREIKFRFWDATNQIMSSDSDGWNESVGINEMFDSLKSYDVIPMQFAGTIEDGQEIWEGDILEYYKGFMTPVFFFAGSFMIFINNNQYIELSQASGGFPKRGNIFENPNLLPKGMIERMNNLLSDTTTI